MTDEELAALEAEKKLLEQNELENEEAKRKADDEEAKRKASNKPSDSEAKLLKEVMATKAKLKEIEAAKKAIEEQYSGIDIEKARAALTALEEQETKELERKGEYDRLLNRQKEIHSTEIEKLKKQIEELTQEKTKFSSVIEDLTVNNSFANSRFILDKLALTPAKAKVLYGSHFEFEDGGVVAYDKPRGSTNRTKIINGSGEAMSFDEAMEYIINNDPDKDILMKAGIKSGSSSVENKQKESFSSKNQPKTSEEKLLSGIEKLLGKK